MRQGVPTQRRVYEEREGEAGEQNREPKHATQRQLKILPGTQQYTTQII